MAAIVAADQVRVRAKLAEMASVLDALDGTAEHAMHVQSVAAEVALIEQVGQSAAEGALSDAGIAVREFPGLVDALGEGKLSEEQLRVLTGAGLSVSHVDSVEQAARRGEFVRVMLAELGSRVLPPKALRMAAARVAESLTEESVSERHERARKTRYVSVTATENGMCLLRARLPLIEGTAIADRLRKQGKALIKARPKPASTKFARSATSAGAAGRRGPSGAGAGAGARAGAGAGAHADAAARADAHARADVDAGAAVDARADAHADVDAGAAVDARAAIDAAAGARAAAPAGPAVVAPDERTIDEVKADLFADMLLTSDPMSCAAAAGIQANVAFTIPILSALTAPGRNGAARNASAVAGSGVSALVVRAASLPAPAARQALPASPRPQRCSTAWSRFRSKRRCASPRMHRHSSGSSPTRSRAPSKPSTAIALRRRCGISWPPATSTAAGPAADNPPRDATSTTPTLGNTAAPQPWRTSAGSASTTTS
ncbi:DUF222 domain-containing protein [Pseudoclavibacter sp. RFBA6]|uniref:DUF222 domain-containing protein n=1 Tax=Pseudoclavibacter sp. RFBA6 TaxID=2080573 RepID=UPI0011B0D79A|nr:DUF222 domain-containing protein [Pseudoclavibacter sp. RFBA6]